MSLIVSIFSESESFDFDKSLDDRREYTCLKALIVECLNVFSNQFYMKKYQNDIFEPNPAINFFLSACIFCFAVDR